MAITTAETIQNSTTTGTITMSVDKQVVSNIKFSSNSVQPVVLADFSNKMHPGNHQVTLSVQNAQMGVPFAINVEFNTNLPASHPECRVNIKTALGINCIIEGDGNDIRVGVYNVTNEPLPMVLAVVGIPGGVEPRHDKLKELVKSGIVDYYEITGHDVALYWRGMDPKQSVEFLFDVVGVIPGKYSAPASRAFLYYTPSQQCWVPGLNVVIDPRN